MYVIIIILLQHDNMTPDMLLTTTGERISVRMLWSDIRNIFSSIFQPLWSSAWGGLVYSLIVCISRLRYLLNKIQKEEVTREELAKNLEYAIRVLDTSFAVEETK